MRTTTLRDAVIKGVIGVSLALVGSAQAAPVGTAAAVQPLAEGTAPGSPTRTLVAGRDIFFEERVVTSSSGRVQVLFLDESTLTIGPNADVVIDKFVFDPTATSGDVAISLGKGLLRFVGGRISKQKEVTIETPAARIGIRGGIALVRHDAVTGRTDCTFLFGQRATVSNQAGSVTLIRPGWSASATSQDVAPRETGRSSRAAIAAALQELEGTSGTAAIEAPRDDVVADGASEPAREVPNVSDSVQRGVVSAIQRRRRAEESPAPPDLPTPAPPQVAANPVSPQAALTGTLLVTSSEGYVGDFGLSVSDPAAQNFVGGPSQGSGAVEIAIANGQTVLEFDGDSLTLPLRDGEFRIHPIDTGTRLGRLSGTGFHDLGADGLDPRDDTVIYELIASGIPGGRIVLAVGPPRTGNVEPTQGFRIDTYSLRPDAAFQSPIPFVSGSVASQFSQPTVSNLTVVRQPIGIVGEPSEGKDGQSLRSGAVLAALAIEGTRDDQRSLLFLAQGAFVSVKDELGDNTPALRLRGSGSLRASSTSDSLSLFADIGTSGGSSVLGDDLDTVVLSNNGFFDDDPALDFSRGETRMLDGGVQEQFGYVHVARRTNASSDASNQRSARALSGFAAGFIESSSLSAIGALPDPVLSVNASGPRGVEIVTDPQSNTLLAEIRTQASLDDASDVERRFTFGGIGSEEGAGFVDDRIFAARHAVPQGNGSSGSDNGILLSSGMVDHSGILPSNVQLCRCEFLNWGYWASDRTGTAAVSPVTGTGGQRVHLATWVAGELADFTEIPITGIARYRGHAIGNVVTRLQSAHGIRPSQYVAVGAFENAWNFATRRGLVTINGFDGQNYAGNVAAGNGRDYQGALLSPTTDISGALQGSFFKGASGPVGTTGGQFHLQDATTGGNQYRAVGTFAASSPGVGVAK